MSRIAGPPIPTKPAARGFTPSPQQQDVFDWIRTGHGSAFLEAVAGSGKTTTLVEACKLMHGYIGFTAFNKKIADEIKSRVNQSNIRVGTFHSFGFGAWRRIAPNVQVDADAKYKMMMEANSVPSALRAAVGRMVSIAKQGVVRKKATWNGLWDVDDASKWEEIIRHFDILLRVEEDRDEKAVIEDLCTLAAECIDWSFRMREKLIDFDDMLWLPLATEAPIWQNDWLLVDEAQDTNPARRLLAGRMLKRNGRSLWVGDRYQAIYGFTGADNDAVDLIVRGFNCEQLPLTVTFRCSQAATELAQHYVPHITAHKSNPQGRVIIAGTRIYADDWRVPIEPDLRESFASPDVPPVPSMQYDTIPSPKPGDVILCRNTKPLVALAFQLLRMGKGCHVEGRDIGKQLEHLLNKWKVDKVIDLIKHLEKYRAREIEKLMIKDANYQIEALNDRVDTLLILAEGCEFISEVRSKISSMFRDSNGDAKYTIVLSTVHKAKGREWDRVFILGFRDYMPSKWAKQDWELEQERNLIYVAITRTKTDLILTPAM